MSDVLLISIFWRYNLVKKENGPFYCHFGFFLSKKTHHSFRIFKAGLKLDTFYNLLVKEALENDALMTSTSSAVDGPAPATSMAGPGPTLTTTTSIIPLDLENTKMAIEVSQSFNNSSSYFGSYLIRYQQIKFLSVLIRLSNKCFWWTNRALCWSSSIFLFCANWSGNNAPSWRHFPCSLKNRMWVTAGSFPGFPGLILPLFLLKLDE